MSAETLPFTVEVQEGLGETLVTGAAVTHQAAIEGVCDTLRAKLAAVEGSSRLQTIRLAASGGLGTAGWEGPQVGHVWR